MFFHLFLLKNEASQWRKEFWLITIRWFKKMKKGAIHYHCSDILFLTAWLVCSSSTKCVFKVHIFCEGHKIWNNLPLEITYQCQQKVEDCFKFMWPLQNVCTLQIWKKTLICDAEYICLYTRTAMFLQEQTWTCGLGLNQFSVLFSFNWVDHD